MFENEKYEILIGFLGDIQENFNNRMYKIIGDYNKQLLIHKECEILREKFKCGIINAEELNKKTIELINRYKI